MEGSDIAAAYLLTFFAKSGNVSEPVSSFDREPSAFEVSGTESYKEASEEYHHDKRVFSKNQGAKKKVPRAGKAKTKEKPKIPTRSVKTKSAANEISESLKQAFDIANRGSSLPFDSNLNSDEPLFHANQYLRGAVATFEAFRGSNGSGMMSFTPKSSHLKSVTPSPMGASDRREPRDIAYSPHTKFMADHANSSRNALLNEEIERLRSNQLHQLTTRIFDANTHLASIPGSPIYGSIVPTSSCSTLNIRSWCPNSSLLLSLSGRKTCDAWQPSLLRQQPIFINELVAGKATLPSQYELSNRQVLSDLTLRLMDPNLR